MNKKLSEEFSKTEIRILSALPLLDEHSLNPQARVQSGTVPKTSWNSNREHQGANEDRSQNDPHPEVGVSLSQSSQELGTEERDILNTHLSSSKWETFSHSQSLHHSLTYFPGPSGFRIIIFSLLFNDSFFFDLRLFFLNTFSFKFLRLAILQDLYCFVLSKIHYLTLRVHLFSTNSLSL